MFLKYVFALIKVGKSITSWNELSSTRLRQLDCNRTLSFVLNSLSLQFRNYCSSWKIGHVVTEIFHFQHLKSSSILSLEGMLNLNICIVLFGDILGKSEQWLLRYAIFKKTHPYCFR